jgi:hypothetical protein
MCAIVFCVRVASYGQNLLTNGSFEVIAFPTNSTASVSVNSSLLPGWTIGGTGNFYVVTTPKAGIVFQAYEGRQFVDFNKDTAFLSQSFSTAPGETYEVSFVVGYRLGIQPRRVIAEVLSSDAVALGTIDVSVAANVGWGEPSRFRFTAIGDISTFKIRSINADTDVDLELDDVRVEPVSQRLSLAHTPFSFCWESKTNRTYQLQYRSTLITNSWTDLDAPIIGTGSSICSTQSVTEPQRFFRVVTLP